MSNYTTPQYPSSPSALRVLSAKKHKVRPYRLPWSDNGDLETIQKRICRDLMDKDVDITEILADVSADGSFKSIEYLSEDKKTWHPIKHLENLKKMQIAIHSEGNPFFESAEAKEKVQKCLNYWVEQHFVCAWSGWYNTIGIGLYIPDILIFGVDCFDEEKKARLLADFKPTLIQNETVKWRVLEREVDATAANLFDEIVASMKVAVIEHDGNTMMWLKQIVENELRVFPSYRWPMHRYDAEGIREDMSFQQHFQLVYFGGYGDVFLNGAARYLKYTEGTQYQVKSACTDLLASFILDGIQFPMRNGYRDFNCSGRGCARKNGEKGIQTSLKNAVDALLAYPSVRRSDALQELVAQRYESAQDHGAGGHRYFYESDYQVMNNDRYMAAVRHASKNTRIFEFLNDENALGYYTGLGGTYYYVEGDEYAGTPPVFDWNKIPGTTTRQGLIPKKSWVKSYNEVGNTRLVGGISNGQVGASYFDLKQQGVRAVKAYFMLSDGVVCLGTDISCGKGNEIVTEINQTNLCGDVYIGDQQLEHGTEFNGVCPFVYHRKMAYFTDKPVQVSAKTVQGDWAKVYLKLKDDTCTADLFALQISHGVHPHQADYAYTVLMNTNPDAARAYAKQPYYEVLENSKSVQAVQDKRSQTVLAIFHRPGCLSVNGRRLKVSKPCCIILENDRLTLTAHTAKSQSITLELDGKKQKLTGTKRPQTIVFSGKRESVCS